MIIRDQGQTINGGSVVMRMRVDVIEHGATDGGDGANLGMRECAADCAAGGLRAEAGKCGVQPQ